MERFPEDLAEDPERKFGVRGGKAQAANEAADFFFCRSGGAPLLGTAEARFQVAAGAESIEQERGETLKIGRSGGNVFLMLRGGLRIAREFVEADGYGLAEVH